MNQKILTEFNSRPRTDLPLKNLIQRFFAFSRRHHRLLNLAMVENRSIEPWTQMSIRVDRHQNLG